MPSARGYAHGFSLTSVELAAPEPAVEAGGLKALPAELARAVRPGEGSDDEIALLHRPDVGARVLDHTDELVPHAAARRAGLHLLVRPQIAAADAGSGHANEGVGRLDNPWIGHVLDPHVAGAVHHGCTHVYLSSACRAAVA